MNTVQRLTKAALTTDSQQFAITPADLAELQQLEHCPEAIRKLQASETTTHVLINRSNIERLNDGNHQPATPASDDRPA